VTRQQENSNDRDAHTPQLIVRESPIAWLYVALLLLARVMACCQRMTVKEDWVAKMGGSKR
jgi:hypothetical protein